MDTPGGREGALRLPRAATVPLSLVLAYRQTGKVALNVLVGALETDPVTAAVPVEFVGRQASLPDAIQRALARSERVLVAWSFYSPDAPGIGAELAAVRAAAPGAPRVLHVAGGVHATAEPEATLALGFDLVGIGEGERTFVDLVTSLARGGDGRGRGIGWRGPDGSLVTGGKADPVVLEAWPPFAVAHERLGPVEITRGCIYACAFCQTPFMNRAKFRHRPLEDVLRWVRLQRQAEFVDYRFISPTSLSWGTQGTEPDLAALDALLGGIREVIGRDRRLWYGTFPSEVRPEHVTPEVLALLARWVDNRTLIIGAQSGSERVLARSHRGHDVPAVERAVGVALEAGFVPHVDFIFGLPGEEPDDVEATLALAERLAERGARVHGHTFMPLPGTPFRKEPPGRIEAAARRRLDRLAARGRLYGQWARQEGIARELAATRKGRAHT